MSFEVFEKSHTQLRSVQHEAETFLAEMQVKELTDEIWRCIEASGEVDETILSKKVLAAAVQRLRNIEDILEALKKTLPTMGQGEFYY